jgi:hypothetical protein
MRAARPLRPQQPVTGSASCSEARERSAAGPRNTRDTPSVGSGVVRRLLALIGVSVLAGGCSSSDSRQTTTRAPNGQDQTAPPSSAITTSMNSAAVQTTVRSHGTSYLRMPPRNDWTDAQYLKLLAAIKNVGATPLVIVHGACGGSARNDHRLTLVDSVFPGRSWVEYGNENDQSCAGNVSRYIAGWNVDVPRPDAVSWHDYVCSTDDSDEYCLDHIARWRNHATDMASRMTTAAYRVPAWITECNMDPQADPRYSRSFIQTWTARALDQWAKLEADQLVDVTMLYTMTDQGNFGLFASDGSLTLQGRTFFG